MDKHNVITMTIEEYIKLLRKVSNNTLDIDDENGEWFYIIAENYGYEDDDIINMIGKELNEEVLDVIVDISKLKVAIIYM